MLDSAHGFGGCNSKEESVEFEDMLFEEQKVSMKQIRYRTRYLQLKRDIMTRGMTFYDVTAATCFGW